MRSNAVNFISAGLHSPKKRDHALARRQLYLNYGALSLATTLHVIGHDVFLVHGEHRSPLLVLHQLRDAGRFPSIYPLMISIPSFYALPWAQEFCKLARSADPNCRIVVGGRWVIGADLHWIKGLIPEANILAPGLCESIIERLLTESPVISRRAEPTPNFTLNHCLVDNYKIYQPSVEASRGCGMGCAFCEERDIPVEKIGDAHKLSVSMQRVYEQYDCEEIHPYLQSSMFMPTTSWASSFANELSRLNLRISWRTETRVDAMTPQTLAYLADSGLSVLDLGLETASPLQISRMRKSENPERYLRRASDLLTACKKYGIRAKVNILLYAGETYKTLAETTDWLDDHRDSVAGVSVGPVVAYGPPTIANPLLNEWQLLGARPVDDQAAFLTGITKMHLSDDFSADLAEAISLSISRRYMDEDAYFALKSFSYYPRNYTHDDFKRDVKKSDPDFLPFQVTC